MMKKMFCLCFAMIFALCGCTAAQAGQSESTVYLPSQSVTEPKETTTAAKTAAQTMLENMTLREKIGQLFIVRPEALGGNMTAFDENTALMLKDYPVGGVALFGKNISDEAQLAELTAELAKYSMLIGIDEEGGKVARIAQNESFDVERFDSMGNVKTADEAENIGKVIGKYLKKYGINLNFAPVDDVDSNPDNPVIGVRAFSCDPDMVSEMVSRQIDGYHSSGIITSIKHFPGHGDTDSDTHTGYVSLDKPWSELKKVELVPFKNNLDKTDTVMVSHITLPQAAYDGLPASLSYDIVTGKLRDELGFDGVIVTDAMEMGAISDTYGGESAVMAIKAGCDIVLMPHDLESAFGAVISAVEKGEISQERVNESVLRVLGLKEKYGII